MTETQHRGRQAQRRRTCSRGRASVAGSEPSSWLFARSSTSSSGKSKLAGREPVSEYPDKLLQGGRRAGGGERARRHLVSAVGWGDGGSCERARGHEAEA